MPTPTELGYRLCFLAAAWPVLLGAVLAQSDASCFTTSSADEDRAWSMFLNASDPMQNAWAASIAAEWKYNTDLTTENQKNQLSAQAAVANFTLAQANGFKKAFPCWRSFKNATVKLALRKVTDSGYSALPPDKFARFSGLQSNMEQLYSVAKVCTDGSNPKELSPDLTKIMATSRDHNQLLWAWKGWHDVTGPAMRKDYVEFVKLINEAADANGYKNMADQWKSDFEYDADNSSAAPYNFADDIEKLYVELKPLYDNLHYYVRNKLKTFYREVHFPADHIPAHLLGNMWAQTWANIIDLVRPYNVNVSIDINPALKRKTVLEMFEISEEFFTSLGLERMPDDFWNRSMIEKPANRDVVCHASAWNFYKESDVRIKMCTDHTMEDFITIHHEMGHIQYYLQYGHLHPAFQEGANSGFHEAIGDVLALSVATPKHLHDIKLLESSVPDNNESDINFLMSMALDKIAFLPFAKLMDDWRWSVFRGETTEKDYNKKWWDLRCKYQGVAPPVNRDESHFDPGAKFHIPSNVPYVRYFVSHILQFQFHRALCKAAKQEGPLHKCDIYRSREAGQLLGSMMKLGSSVPWPDALEKLTGTRSMDGSAVVEYFQPLVEWLIKTNGGYMKRTEAGCPDVPSISVPSGVCSSASAAISGNAGLLLLTASVASLLAASTMDLLARSVWS